MEAMQLEAGGEAPAVANVAALKVAAIDPRKMSMVIAEAGPRLRGVLPATIDDVPREPRRRQAMVETLFWPWPAAWPKAGSDDHPGSKLPGTTATTPGVAQAVSLTLDNRSDAPARGR